MLKIAVIETNEQTKALLNSYIENDKELENRSFYDCFSDEIPYKELDLILFDITSDSADSILEKIKNLKNRYKNLHFIAMSYEINSELVSKTLHSNIRDFILKPIIPGILEASIKKIKDLKNDVPYNLSRSVCVFSSKGGVGKTSFSLNLASEISTLTDENVCLLDLAGGDVSTYLNTKPKFKMDYIIKNLETSDKELLLSLMTKGENKNLYVLSDNSIDLKLTPNDTTRLINSLKNIFPYVIIDTTSVVDENLISILNSSDLILLMCLATLASIRNCQKSIELFNEIGYNPAKVKLIVNRFSENQDINLKDIEYTLKKEVFYKIPNNYLTLSDAINQASSVSKTNPQSNIARAYKNIAKEILNLNFVDLDKDSKYKFNHGIFNLLRRMGE